MGAAMPFSVPAGPKPPDFDARPMLRRPKVPRHRRVWLLLASLALAAVGGMGSYMLVAAADERVDVLAASRDIPWGAAITRDDLSRARVATDEAGRVVVPADDIDSVVGQTATGPIAAGRLLAPSDVGERPVPGPGELLIGLRAEPGTIPGRGLRPGEVVHVVPIVDADSASDPVGESGSGFDARVLDVGQPDGQGVVTVDVVVSAQVAQQATDAAAGRVLLVLRGPDR